MRLHEFTDPKDYSLPDTEPVDVAKQIERTHSLNAADDSGPGSRKKSKAEKTTLIGAQ